MIDEESYLPTLQHPPETLVHGDLDGFVHLGRPYGRSFMGFPWDEWPMASHLSGGLVRGPMLCGAAPDGGVGWATQPSG